MNPYVCSGVLVVTHAPHDLRRGSACCYENQVASVSSILQFIVAFY